MAKNFDVIVIGAGPAGYVAAIRCAQLGLSTACIDQWEVDGKGVLGGTCLNVGCIPSKALLETADLFHKAQHKMQGHGIKVSKPSIDIAAMQARKQELVQKLTGGVAQLFKAHKITAFYGHGRLMADKNVTVVDSKTNKVSDTLTAKDIIIATGSTPIELGSMPFDHKSILDSEDLLALDAVPKKLTIVGAGVIGLELGSVWNNLGSDVTLLEATDKFLPMAEPAIAREAARVFKADGLKVELGAMVKKATKSGKSLTVEYEQGGKTHKIKTDKLAVLVGRKPNTVDLLAPDCGVDLDERGCIAVDEYCQTKVPGIWAIGDVVRGPMLAHKGSEEGVHVAEAIAGKGKHALDLNCVPSVIYTHPEISWVGKTETELKEAGVAYNSANFPFAASGRALASGSGSGQIRVLADKQTDRILGVHMIGEHTSEILAEAVFAMQYQASAEDLGRTIHAHPTLSEALKEAALGISKSAIHKK